MKEDGGTKMNCEGIDTAARISAQAAEVLRSEGKTFAGRYLGSPTLGKTISPAEAEDIRTAGLGILLFYEISGTEMKNGAAPGAAHGADARKWADELGVPEGTAIYFAVDYEPESGEYGAVEAYIRAAGAALGKKYRCGMYGCYSLVEAMAQRGACEKFCQCSAWSYGRLSAHADAYQYQWQGGAEAMALAMKTGFAVDLTRCTQAAGLWPAKYIKYDEDDGGATYEPQSGAAAQPWYAEAMAWAKANGIINDGRPNDSLTRAEMATIMQRMDKRVDEKIKRALPEDDSLGGLITE